MHVPGYDFFRFDFCLSQSFVNGFKGTISRRSDDVIRIRCQGNAENFKAKGLESLLDEIDHVHIVISNKDLALLNLTRTQGQFQPCRFLLPGISVHYSESGTFNVSFELHFQSAVLEHRVNSAAKTLILHIELLRKGSPYINIDTIESDSAAELRCEYVRADSAPRYGEGFTPVVEKQLHSFQPYGK